MSEQNIKANQETAGLKKELSIIIVNYNGETVLEECLQSIYRSKTQSSYEIIVIDNDSKDNSIQLLERHIDTITLIKNSENKGFSAANNQGIDVAVGEKIFLLNNDTILNETTLETLMTYYNDHPEIGAIAPKLLNKDKSLQAPGSILGAWQFNSEKPKKLSFLCGAAFLTTKEILEKTNGLDENFFFYNEDIDLCKQIIKLGYPLIYYPKASLVHLGGQSTATRRAGSIIEGYRGGLYLCYKHYPKIIYLLYRMVLFIDLIPRLVLNSLLSVVNKNKRDIAKVYLTIVKINMTNDIFLK